MPGKIKLLLLLSAFLLTMCKNYDQAGPVVAANGLSCQNFIDYGVFSQEEGAECFYACPDGTVRQPAVPGNFSTESTLYSASKQELDSQFCGIASQPTSTIAPVSTSPPLAVSTPSPTLTPTIQVSPTAEISPTAQAPLLTGAVTLCDETLGLISFRMVETAPDLTDKILTVQVAEQETACAVNPVNTSLLTCDLPSPITFPARVLVSLDGAVVNDFTYDGIGCILVDTPIPALGATPTP
jgi:hypothetical protein